MLWGSIVTIQKKNLKINRNNNSYQQETLLPIAMMTCKLVENAITQTENHKVTAQGHTASKHRGYQPAQGSTTQRLVFLPSSQTARQRTFLGRAEL